MSSDGITRVRRIDGKTFRVESDGRLTPVESQTDWARVDALTDEEIAAAVANDPDAAPIADAEWFARARLRHAPKETVTIRIDSDLLDYFRRDGRGYQTRINAVLRAFVDAQGERS